MKEVKKGDLMEFKINEYKYIYNLKYQINYIEKCSNDTIDWYQISSTEYFNIDLLEYYENNFKNKIIIEESIVLNSKYIKKNLKKLDIKKIIKIQLLTEDLLVYIVENYKISERDWINISMNHIFSLNFIEKYKNFIDFGLLSMNVNITEEIIEKYKDKLDWEKISSSRNITEKFIEKHKDKLNWKILSCKPGLSEEFIEKHQGELDIESMVYYQKFSEEFIDKHSNDLGMQDILENQTLSEEFIDKHKSKFSNKDWELVIMYQKLSEEFIEDNYDDYLKLSLNKILKYQSLSMKFIEKYKTFSDLKITVLDTQKLSEEFMENNDYLYSDSEWYKIIKYQSLSEGFILKYINKFKMDDIFEYQSLSEEFIIKHTLTLRNWSDISKYQNLSEGFIVKYKDKLNWYEIPKNNKIDIGLLKKFKDDLKFDFMFEDYGVNDKIGKEEKYLKVYKILGKKMYKKIDNFNIKFFNFKVNFEKEGLDISHKKYQNRDWKRMSILLTVIDRKKKIAIKREQKRIKKERTKNRNIMKSKLKVEDNEMFF